MKNKILLVLILFSVPIPAFAQWPGYFHTFLLEDPSGKPITASNSDYRITPIHLKGSNMLLSVKVCPDGKTWRYYAGGDYKEFGKLQRIKIERTSSKAETMVIEFPPPLSKGSHPAYTNLFLGTLKFSMGKYRVKVPDSASQWDGLKEIKLCPDNINNYSFSDVSGFQK